MSQRRTGIGRARARVGLAGNPSDLYGGAVVAFAIEAFDTTVTIDAADGWEVPADGRELVAATVARFARHTGRDPAPGRVRIATTVPRQSGLAGSSAIVIAALRALAERAGRRLDAFELAELALAVEVEDLGIVAGAQDRVAQAYESVVVVDVADGLRADRIRTIDRAVLPRLVVAWARRPGTPSGDVHAPVRARFDAGDPAVLAAASAWRGHALAAERALLDGDRAALGAAMDGSFDQRTALFTVDAADTRMVELARSLGAAANQCGSGGSVVALPRDAAGAGELQTAFTGSGFHALVV